MKPKAVIAKAPCRVDLAGGTLDIWPLNVFVESPMTVNFAVNCYTQCVLKIRKDKKLVVKSLDQKKTEKFVSLKRLMAANAYQIPLACYALRFFKPGMGLDVEISSESPTGAGIAASSSLLISVVSALDELLNTKYSKEQLRQIAQNIETQIIKVPTGCQDYYPALYGGVSAIHLEAGGARREALAVSPGEINKRLTVIYTGMPHNSGVNNWEVFKAFIDGDWTVRNSINGIAPIACAMRLALLRKRWSEVANLLNREWSNRRKNSPNISTPEIEKLFKLTRALGSAGAKVCGAGGGGCVCLFTEPELKPKVLRLAQRLNLQILPVSLCFKGVTVKEY